MKISDAEREKLVSTFPWIRDVDAAIGSARDFVDAVGRLRSLPIIRIGERRRKRRTNLERSLNNR